MGNAENWLKLHTMRRWLDKSIQDGPRAALSSGGSSKFAHIYDAHLVEDERVRHEQRIERERERLNAWEAKLQMGRNDYA